MKMEKETLKAVLVADLTTWISTYREGQAVLSEDGKNFELSCINKTVHGASCYEDSHQETTTFSSISHYDLETYFKYFIVNVDDFSKYGFGDNHYNDYFDKWDKPEQFIGYCGDERINEDYYYNYDNKFTMNINIDGLCDYLLNNPFKKPLEEFKRCFEQVKFDELVAQYRSDKLENSLDEKPLEKKKPKI